MHQSQLSIQHSALCLLYVIPTILRFVFFLQSNKQRSRWGFCLGKQQKKNRLDLQ